MAILPTAQKKHRHGFGSAAATDIHSDFVNKRCDLSIAFSALLQVLLAAVNTRMAAWNARHHTFLNFPHRPC